MKQQATFAKAVTRLGLGNRDMDNLLHHLWNRNIHLIKTDFTVLKLSLFSNAEPQLARQCAAAHASVG